MLNDRFTMKKLSPLYLLVVLFLVACGSDNSIKTTLQVNIKDAGNDTLYIYGMDKYYDRMDTLPMNNGKLTTDLPIDTLVGLWLLLPDGQTFPLYANKGDKLTINGTISDSLSLTITGNPLNDELLQFNQTLQAISESQIQNKAATFITEHPFSLVSIYLLDNYFVQTANPDVKRIQRLIEKMSGELKDRPYIIALNEQLSQDAIMEVGKLAPYFRVKDTEGNIITRTKFNKQYLLINFWASWDEASLEANQMLKRIHKKYKKRKDFTMLGISLDVDQHTWKQKIASDTLDWNQTIEEKSWQGEVVSQYAINQLPTNLLLNTAGRVEKINITEEELDSFLKDVDKKEADKKKKRK